MVPVIHRAEIEIGGKTLSFETGRMANLANCSIIVRYGDTECLVTTVMSREDQKGITFFPLMVNFEERMYAAGKIPGGFIKREGRPGEPSILAGRVIDRPIRPLFPDNLRRQVDVTVIVISTDHENIPDMVGLNGATCALLLSDIPFNYTVAGVRIAKVDGEYIINPTYSQKDASEVELTVVGTREKIMMIEANCTEIPEDEILKAIETAHIEIRRICDCLDEFRNRAGLTKIDVPPVVELPDEIKSGIEKIVNARIDDIYSAPAKKERETVFQEIKVAVDELLVEIAKNQDKDSEVEDFSALAHDYENKYLKKIVRKNVLENDRRIDKRGLREVREIRCEVGLIPRSHGTGLFTRGETQVLSTVTLGAPGDLQVLDDIHPYIEKRYLHHYQAMPFSYGDTGPMRGPGRREIGHGALAEKAIKPMIPDQEKFPYVIRVNSDVMMSNGSTSMGSTCASTLALMDAGVPIKNPVSGVAMGLVTGDKGNYKILTDIMGTEDHLGDMDFKVAGTSQGVTAIQMDLKIDGITHQMISQILEQAKEGRAFILSKMLETIPQPRPDLSPFAPRITILHVRPEKIGEIIGPGGKTIRKIIEETGVDIDIEDDGRVYITSTNVESSNEAIRRIEELTMEIEIGKIYKGKIVRIENYGAFVQLLPGKDGLLHISQFSRERISSVNDVVKLGQEIYVKVNNIDDMGRVDLTAIDVAGNQDNIDLSQQGKSERKPYDNPSGGGEGGGRPRGRDSQGRDRKSGPPRRGGYDRRD